jgi:hypothetical protein
MMEKLPSGDRRGIDISGGKAMDTAAKLVLDGK